MRALAGGGEAFGTGGGDEPEKCYRGFGSGVREEQGGGFDGAEAVLEEETVEAFQLQAGGAVDAGAAEADDVEAGEKVGLVGDAVGREVGGEGGVSLDHGEVADADELMIDGASAEEAAVADADVAGDEDGVGDDVVIPDGGVVAEVAVGHEKIVIADEGFAAGAGAAVDGDVFAEGVMISDADAAGGGGVEGEGLGISADDGAAVDGVVGAHDDA
ncbi:MAG: hypothetical protein JWL81_2005, partial [Verrucomicrobiales bacterium]|nr:hypothetical protein [Verrucomicrobiales bacterium]